MSLFPPIARLTPNFFALPPPSSPGSTQSHIGERRVCALSPDILVRLVPFLPAAQAGRVGQSWIDIPPDTPVVRRRSRRIDDGGIGRGARWGGDGCGYGRRCGCLGLIILAVAQMHPLRTC